MLLLLFLNLINEFNCQQNTARYNFVDGKHFCLWQYFVHFFVSCCSLFCWAEKKLNMMKHNFFFLSLFTKKIRNTLNMYALEKNEQKKGEINETEQWTATSAEICIHIFNYVGVFACEFLYAWILIFFIQQWITFLKFRHNFNRNILKCFLWFWGIDMIYWGCWSIFSTEPLNWWIICVGFFINIILCVRRI